MASSTRRKSLPASPLFTTRIQEKLQQNRHTVAVNQDDADVLSFAVDIDNEYDDSLAKASLPSRPLIHHEQVPSLLKRIEEKQSKKKPPPAAYPFHPTIDPKSAQIGNNYHNPTHHHNIHNYTHTYTHNHNHPHNHNHNHNHTHSHSHNPSPSPQQHYQAYSPESPTTNNINNNNNNNNSNNNSTRVSPDERETLKSSVHSAHSAHSTHSAHSHSSDETGKKPRTHMLYEMDKDITKHREDMKRESEMKEMAECTFAPNILPTNVPLSSTSRDIVGRLHGWHQDKMEKITKLRVETQTIKDEQSVEGCTFKPALYTPKSPKVDQVSPPHGVNKYLNRQQKAKEKREIAKSAEFIRENFVTENWSARPTEPQEFKMMIREKLKSPSTSSTPTPTGRRSSSPLTSKTSLAHSRRTPTPSHTINNNTQMRLKNAPRSQSFSAYSAPSTPAEPAEPKPFTPKYAGGLISVADVEKIRSLLGAYSVPEEESEEEERTGVEEDRDGSGVDEGATSQSTLIIPQPQHQPQYQPQQQPQYPQHQPQHHNPIPSILQRSGPSPVPAHHTSSLPHSRSPTPLTAHHLSPPSPPKPATSSTANNDKIQKLKAEHIARPNSAPPQLNDPFLLSKAKHSPRATVHPPPLIVRPYHNHK